MRFFYRVTKPSLVILGASLGTQFFENNIAFANTKTPNTHLLDLITIQEKGRTLTKPTIFLQTVNALLEYHLASQAAPLVRHHARAPKRVFISYSWAVPTLANYEENLRYQYGVRHFARHLKLAGIDVWCDIDRERAGDEFYLKIQEALFDSDVVLQIGIPAYITKVLRSVNLPPLKQHIVYTEAKLIEEVAKLLRETTVRAGLPSKLIPVLMSGNMHESTLECLQQKQPIFLDGSIDYCTELFKLIRDIYQIPTKDKDFENLVSAFWLDYQKLFTLNELHHFEKLEALRERYQTEVEKLTQKHSLIQMPWYMSRPKVLASNAPTLSPHHQERELYLKRILAEFDKLRDELERTIVVCYHENPIGKTELAAKYFKDSAKRYTHRVWLNAASTELLIQSWQKFSDDQGIQYENLLDWFALHPGALLVFDGLVAGVDINPYLSLSTHNDILITTRDVSTAPTVAAKFKLEGMTLDESIALIRHCSGSREPRQNLVEKARACNYDPSQLILIKKPKAEETLPWTREYPSVSFQIPHTLKQGDSIFVEHEEFMQAVNRLGAHEDISASALKISITAMSGMGKTCFARHYLQQLSNGTTEDALGLCSSIGEDRTPIWLKAWIGTGSSKKATWEEEILLVQLQELAERVKISHHAAEIDVRTPLSAATTLQHYLNNHPGWVIVFDDILAYAHVEPYLPTRGGFVLMTGQSKRRCAPDTTSVKSLHIDKLPEDFLLKLVYKNLGPTLLADMALKIIKAVNYYPLALNQFCAVVRENPLLSIEEILEDFNKNKLDYYQDRDIEFPEERPYEITTWAAMSMCLNSIIKNARRTDIPLIMSVLQHCALVHPDNISIRYLKEATGLTDDKDLQRILKKLENYSLIRLNLKDHTLDMHEMVQDALLLAITHKKARQSLVAHDYFNEPAYLIDKAYAVAIKFEPLASLTPLQKQSEKASLLQHQLNLYKHDSALLSTLDTEEAPSLRRHRVLLVEKIGSQYLHFGKHAEAVHYYLEANRLNATVNVEGKYPELYALRGAGLGYSHLGELDKALDCYNKILRIHRENNLPESADCIIHSNKGLAYTVKANKTNNPELLQKAEEQHQLAIRVYREHSLEAADPDGLCHYHEIYSLGMLANIKRQQGKLAEAIAIYQHVLWREKRKETLGTPELEHYMSTLFALGRCYLEYEKIPEAYACLKKSYELYLEYEGPDARMTKLADELWQQAKMKLGDNPCYEGDVGSLGQPDEETLQRLSTQRYCKP